MKARFCMVAPVCPGPECGNSIRKSRAALTDRFLSENLPKGRITDSNRCIKTNYGEKVLNFNFSYYFC